MAKKAKKGKAVQLSFVGRLEDGQIVDTANSIMITIGAGQIVPGLEKALVGMKPGASKKVALEPMDAYGFRSMENVFEVDPSQVPVPFEIKEGQRFKVKQIDGSVREVLVLEVSPGAVLLDANHLLASETLHYELTLHEVF